jgi:integrase
LCILQGVQPKVTQDRLGHKRIATTLDIYAHVTPSMKRAAAASLDAVLSLAAAVTAGD